MADLDLPEELPPLTTLGQRARRALLDPERAPGPAVARLFHRLLAVIFLVAWLSLGAQIDVLIGPRGLLPLAPFLAAARARGLGPSDLPTIFLALGPSPRALHAPLIAGAVLAILALLGLAPRLSFALQTALYLSYAVACRAFLSFQWDNLLLECGLLAALLPARRRAPVASLLFRVLLFKLYVESGLAKWLSPAGDWQDGSAMTYYFETAPLPTRLALLLHALPEAIAHLESYGTLALELVVPFFLFGPRRARRLAFVLLTAFQLANIATANYGFFAYLALALHVFLLEDRDLIRARRALARRLPRARRLLAWARGARIARAGVARRALARLLAAVPFALSRASHAPRVSRAARLLAYAFAVAYGAASLLEACLLFGGYPQLAEAAAPIRALYAPLRVVNTYHLFAAVTRERIEPEIQTLEDRGWTAHDLAYKPGDPRRAPPFVAPHQPRVDFVLWFYGLSARRGPPPYALALLERLCHDPEAIAGLFPSPLPATPLAARFAFYNYHFTSPEQQRASGAYWFREWLGASESLTCRTESGDEASHGPSATPAPSRR